MAVGVTNSEPLSGRAPVHVLAGILEALHDETPVVDQVRVIEPPNVIVSGEAEKEIAFAFAVGINRKKQMGGKNFSNFNKRLNFTER